MVDRVWAYLGNHGDIRRIHRVIDSIEHLQLPVVVGTDMLAPLSARFMPAISVAAGRSRSGCCVHLGTRLSHSAPPIPIDHPDHIGDMLMPLKDLGVTHISLDNAAAWDGQTIHGFLELVTYAARCMGLEVWPEANRRRDWIQTWTARSVVEYDTWVKRRQEQDAAQTYRIEPRELVIAMHKHPWTDDQTQIAVGRTILAAGGMLWVRATDTAVLTALTEVAV